MTGRWLFCVFILFTVPAGAQETDDLGDERLKIARVAMDEHDGTVPR